MIYLNTKKDKNHDLYSHSSIMDRTKNLQIFNNLKKWNQEFADEKTKLIDIHLLKNLFMQMKRKIECHMIGHQVGLFQDGRTHS